MIYRSPSLSLSLSLLWLMPYTNPVAFFLPSFVSTEIGQDNSVAKWEEKKRNWRTNKEKRVIREPYTPLSFSGAYRPKKISVLEPQNPGAAKPCAVLKRHSTYFKALKWSKDRSGTKYKSLLNFWQPWAGISAGDRQWLDWTWRKYFQCPCLKSPLICEIFVFQKRW